MSKKQGLRLDLIVTAASAVVAIALAVIILLVPVKGNKEGNEGFSAANAYSYLGNIAKEPHSVFDRAALEDVRQYLVDTISSFGVTPDPVRHKNVPEMNLKTGKNEQVEIQNIYAQIPGTSGQNILLMAHYDSSPYKIKYGEVTSGSHGAADDGYGVATMLEILHQLKRNGKPLINGVKFVFTDSEETGLNGAAAVINENPDFLKDVNLVVNIEARGNRGPLYMFQTSSGNTKIIDLYSKVSNPFSFSVAAEVYKYLPSDTDLTPFLNAGYNCINFSTLNDLRNYHTQNDIIVNTSVDALKAYGSQLYPLVTSYVYGKAYSDSKSFDSSSDSVFFTLLPGVLVHYSAGLSWVMIIIAVILTLAVIILAVRRKLINMTGALKSLLLWLAFMLAAAAAGYLAIWLPCLITGTKFHLTFMPYVPFDRGFLALAALIITALAALYMKLHTKLKSSTADTLTGGLLLNILFMLLFGLVLHGGTYLFLWPVLLTSLFFACGILPKGNKKWRAVSQILRALLIIFTVLEYFLLVYSLFLALTIGALVVITLLISIPLSLLVPSVCLKPDGE